jgi:hypothetical protein
MIDAVMPCTICGAPMGKCDCWANCPCGWAFQKGGACRNPRHQVEDTAAQLAGHAAAMVLGRVRDRHATDRLESAIIKEFSAIMVEWMMADFEERQRMEADPK